MTPSGSGLLVNTNSRELAYIQSELSRRNVVFTPSVANFVLVEFETDVKDLFVEFQKRGVIIRPAGGPGLVNCARRLGRDPARERAIPCRT